jgi:phytoene dehydrogenase-like protein
MRALDAVVIGAGPNGLTAAVVLASSGLSVRVYEAAPQVGGGARTSGLTLPGFQHDPCSAVHPLGAGSPILRRLPLHEHGLAWIHPDLPMAHPFPDGSAAVLDPSLEATAASLGRDGGAYLDLLEGFRGRWPELAPEILRAPLARLPRHPLLLAAFGLAGLPPLAVAVRRFREKEARGFLAGLAAHTMAPLTTPLTSAVALTFALAGHDVGWPFARGGSGAISAALASHLTALGGEIVTGQRVRRLADLPRARAYLFDVSAADLAWIAGSHLPPEYRGRLRHYRRGPAAFKLDYALSERVPWTAEECRRAGTVHVGGEYTEVEEALAAVHRGQAPAVPFLITAQPSLWDPTRAPAGHHTFWAYAHVPHGWPGDLTSAVEAQLERFAPGFRDLILARTVTTPADLEHQNPNYLGGDIAGGAFLGLQTLFRPTLSRVPYATPHPAVFLCSSSTPPGAGVHGMSGYHAARVALRRRFGHDLPAELRI